MLIKLLTHAYISPIIVPNWEMNEELVTYFPTKFILCGGQK